MAVFESRWRPNMTREEGIAIVSAAIQAGIFNDLGSGSNVDVCVITKTRTDMLRNYETPNERVPKERNYKFRTGTTGWTKESVRSLISEETITPIHVGDAMDVS